MSSPPPRSEGGAQSGRHLVTGCEHRSRLWNAIGTVTQELLKSAPVPVIAVPQPAGQPAGARG